MSPRRVLAEHSSAELTEWRAFDRAGGLDLSADYRAGVVAAQVWNAAGGIPESSGSNARRRAATPADFFAAFNTDDEPDGRGAAPHDGASATADDIVVDDVVDEDAERARVSEAMRNMWAMWGLRQNAALRAAEQLDAGEPPDDPNVN